ncbi:hypothetical protein K491DRAFT_697088 [Lophiostoma macrostomum CBS 122681]|uniref:Uncharacterized protein n=1 Tax=Lophiostoma macrostomum CBS 122681 TaxID=1314788 RepID=A0A6A6SUG3_9PLEO|nr:hypothetical protein K491DRAFT_697088 [Lophiostoma macrostomum CBS 122681]
MPGVHSPIINVTKALASASVGERPSKVLVRTPELIEVPANRIRELHCAAIHALSTYWVTDHYSCTTNQQLITVFRYLSKPKSHPFRSYPSDPNRLQEELTSDCFLYTFGRKYQCHEISKSVRKRILRYKPQIGSGSLYDKLIKQAIDVDDRPLCAFLMKERGFPSDIVPSVTNVSSPTITEIEDEPSEDFDQFVGYWLDGASSLGSDVTCV